MIPISKPQIGAEEKAAVMGVMDSGVIASGPVTEAFEKEFAASTGARHALAVANGTAALHAALLGVGLKPGDEVITTPFTFVASVNAILFAGGVPRLVDVDPSTFNLDPRLLAKAVGPKTKAILPVHLYGLAADMAAILDAAKDHGLAVVEDAAQAHGAVYHGKQVGTLGDAGCFSMYPTKNMAMNEGGMVTTDRDDVADLVKSVRNHGRGLATLGTYDHVRLGHNFRSNDIASAIGRVQLRRLPEFNRIRRANAARHAEALAGHPDLVAPVEPAGRQHVWHQYTVRSRSRDAFVAHMKAAGVGTGIYYPKVVTDYPHLVPYKESFPVSERLAKEVASIPVHPGLSADDLGTIQAALRAWRPGA
ncbi:MAG TPA: DegT/DnrJ/EryC1/StrS family aminotransferase [Candidatus Thermoplasmatota archaeon]|nr:DegT/DnrJ/EryC1/StrS family aminotransferase [Candidatus Thermoplasmatota archaeon]